MRLAFDLHGSLDSDPMLLLFFKGLIYMGRFKCFIVSGPPVTQIINELKKLGINDMDLVHFEIISVVDFLKSKNAVWRKDEKGYWFDETLWWESKGLICLEYSIDIIFDNDIEYAKHMPDTTRFILWKGEINEII